MLNRLVKFGDKEFAKVALEKFEKHIKGTDIIPADLRGVIYRAVISADGKNAFTSLMNVSYNIMLVVLMIVSEKEEPITIL